MKQVRRSEEAQQQQRQQQQRSESNNNVGVKSLDDMLHDIHHQN